MAAFQLSPQADPNKVFLVNLSVLSGHLSPLFYISQPKTIIHSKKLKEIAEVNPSRERPKFDDDEIVPYVGLPETDEHTNEIMEVALRPYKEVKGRSIILPNEILFARIEPSIFNKKYILTKDLKGYEYAFTSTEFYTIQAEKVSEEFLFLCLLTDYVYSQIAGKTTGSTGRRRLDAEVFKNIKIPVPSPEIQTKVVEIYGKAYNAKQTAEAEARRLLSSIDAYILAELGITLPTTDNSLENRVFYANFSEVSGGRFDPKLHDNNTKALFRAVEQGKYRKVSLRSLVTHSVAGSWGFDEALPLPEDEYTQTLCIRATEFDNLFNLNLEGSRVKYRQIGNAKLKSMDIQPNDLLIEKSGGSPDQPVGRISILNDEISEKHTVSFSNFIHKIRIDTLVCLPEYLFCYLKTMHNIKVTEAMQSQTNGIRNLIMREYFKQTVILPDPDKQKEIAKTAQAMRQKAQELMQQGKAILEQTKREVEEMILAPPLSINH